MGAYGVIWGRNTRVIVSARWDVEIKQLDPCRAYKGLQRLTPQFNPNKDRTIQGDAT
jgi:hypothetical protein